MVLDFNTVPEFINPIYDDLGFSATVRIRNGNPQTDSNVRVEVVITDGDTNLELTGRVFFLNFANETQKDTFLNLPFVPRPSKILANIRVFNGNGTQVALAPNITLLFSGTTDGGMALHPPAVTGLVVSNITESAASFSWTKVVADPPLLDYIISILNVDTNTIFLGSTTIGFAQTGTAISALTPDTNYRFSIIARNSAGVSPETTADWTTLGVTTATVPDRPIQNNIAVISDTELGISWSAPSNDGGEPITSYRIIVIKQSTGETVSRFDVGIIPLSARATGLEPATEYKVRVAAINIIGRSALSNSKFATTTGVPITKPNTPVLTVSGIKTTKAKLSWSVAGGAANQDSFRLVLANVDAGTEVAFKPLGDITLFNLSNLIPATRYTVVIVAIKEGVESNPSTIEMFTTVTATEPPIGTKHLVIKGDPVPENLQLIANYNVRIVGGETLQGSLAEGADIIDGTNIMGKIYAGDTIKAEVNIGVSTDDFFFTGDLTSISSTHSLIATVDGNPVPVTVEPFPTPSADVSFNLVVEGLGTPPVLKTIGLVSLSTADLAELKTISGVQITNEQPSTAALDDLSELKLTISIIQNASLATRVQQNTLQQFIFEDEIEARVEYNFTLANFDLEPTFAHLVVLDQSLISIHTDVIEIFNPVHQQTIIWKAPAFGNKTVTLRFIVLDSSGRPMGSEIEAIAEDTTIPPKPPTPEGSSLLQKVFGAFALGTAITLLSSRGK